MADYTFLKNIFVTVDAAIGTYISSTASAVASAVGPVAKQMFLLYIIMYAPGFAPGGRTLPVCQTAVPLLMASDRMLSSVLFESALVPVLPIKPAR